MGQIKEHPALKIEREATVVFDRLAQSFGMTPIGRTRLGLAELHRRSLAEELASSLGKPDLHVVEGTADEDAA